MKHKGKNRVLAALLAAAMMFQMLPLMVFADDGAASSDVKIKGKEGTYTSLKEAVEKAESGDTILLGEGDYTLYKVDSNGMTKGKDLTFVGKGTDKTTWYIGAYVTDPNKTGEYTGDYCFDGAGTVTFENMTLRSGPATDTNAKLGFIRPDNTVVDKCEIVGWTAFWGYDSAVFKNTTFKPIEGKDAIWVYSSKEATFDDCTFTAGRAVKVYTEENKSVTVNFNNCTVENSGSHPAIYIDEYVLERDGGTQRYNINITGNNHVKAQTNTYTCSKLFGFRTANAHPGHFTNVSIDGKLVWSEGEMLTHDYTDGEKDNAYNITYSSSNPNGWVEEDGHYKRHVIKTCKYCGYNEEKDENGYKLAYKLNGGTAAAGADYTEKIVAENKTVTLAAAPAPAQEGVYFLGWEDGNGKQYNADATITLTANTTLTAQWGDVPPVEPDTPAGGSGDGGAGVVVAGALLGGAGYLLGTRLWLESTFGFVPANRIELAMALWKRADCPAPVSTELYPDIDEDDTDAQAAARWCVEQDLMKDFARTNSDGTQTVKFKPYDYVFRPQSLVKWYKLEKLLNEQQSTNA